MRPRLLDPTSVHVQLHIDELHREAAQRRLVQDGRKHKSDRRKALAIRLQRAPAA